MVGQTSQQRREPSNLIMPASPWDPLSLSLSPFLSHNTHAHTRT